MWVRHRVWSRLDDGVEVGGGDRWRSPRFPVVLVRGETGAPAFGFLNRFSEVQQYVKSGAIFASIAQLTAPSFGGG